MAISLEEEGGRFLLKTDLYQYMPEIRNQVITTDLLGMAFEPEQRFENPDGSPIVMDVDYHGKEWGEYPGAGPFSGYGPEREYL